jgi:hypothetical protein
MVKSYEVEILIIAILGGFVGNLAASTTFLVIDNFRKGLNRPEDIGFLVWWLGGLAVLIFVLWRYSRKLKAAELKQETNTEPEPIQPPHV